MTRAMNTPDIPVVEKAAKPVSDEKDLEANESNPDFPEYSTTEHGSQLRQSDSESEDEDEVVRTDSIARRVLSRITSRSSVTTLAPPPDGGFTAWMVVFAGHLVIMNTWGVVNSFGAFQTYYATSLSLPPSTISWIGSLQIFLLFFVGTFTGRLTDAGYFRHCLVTGLFLIALSAFTAAQSTKYWQIFLSQGVCFGLGNGFVFCPTMATISTYWQKKRALAIGLAAAGSSTGGIVFPIVVRRLLPEIGYAWTMRTIGFIQIAGLVIAMLFLKTRVPPRTTGRLIDLASFKELEYTFYAVGAFMCFLGLYIPFYYLASFSRDVIGMPYSTSLDFLLVLNGIGLVGRIIPCYVADRLGSVNLFIPCAGICAITMYFWAAVHNSAGLYAWACIYGIGAGGVSSLFPAALSSLTTDLRKQGTRMGMIFTIVSFAALIGPPIAGQLITRMNGGYLGAQMLSGSAFTLSTLFMCLAREVKRKKSGLGMRSKV